MELYTGHIAHTPSDPFTGQGLEIIEDGALAINDQGVICDKGSAQALRQKYPDAVSHHHDWLIPGLVDGHLHFPQIYCTAAPGLHLLDWLHRQVFPRERAFAEPAVAKRAARHFVARLIRGGTTTSLVYGSQFEHATKALFQTADSGGVRMFAGLTLMDRDGPADLLTSPDQAYAQNLNFINQLKGHPRLGYALTPRFALSCTPELMEGVAELHRKHPETLIQTHMNENNEEIDAVQKTFAQLDHYAAVYDAHHLLGERTILAHNIHASDTELSLLSQRGCHVCTCPNSNAFLGSGLFPLKRHLEADISVLIGTDIGAGGNTSILCELSDLYRTQQLRRMRLTSGQLLYLATAAGAKALGLGHRIGDFQIGREADLLGLDLVGDLKTRVEHANDAEEALFALLNLGDERLITRTVVAGRTLSDQVTTPA